MYKQTPSLITILLTLSACASEEAVKVQNNAPTVTITSHSGTVSLQDGYEVTFQAQVQDDNHTASTLMEAPTIVTPMEPPPETTTLVMEWLLLKSSNVVLYG